jgi:hypothetical protein
MSRTKKRNHFLKKIQKIFSFLLVNRKKMFFSLFCGIFKMFCCVKTKSYFFFQKKKEVGRSRKNYC